MKRLVKGNENEKIIYTSVDQFMDVKTSVVQPGERLIALLGYDYKYMDSAVKDIAAGAEQIILDLEKLIARLMLPTRNVESILPNIENN